MLRDGGSDFSPDPATLGRTEIATAEGCMRILVVDDDEAVRDSLARTLRFEGHQVDTAGDDRNAIDIVHAGSRTP